MNMDMADLKVSEIIEEICQISRDPSGEITRLAFSEPWMQAQTGLQGFFTKLGLTSFFDQAGNLHGQTGGGGGVILTGSHVDTVRNGGKYDGLYGIVGSALAVSRLVKKHGRPGKTLEVIAFSEEEGSRFPFSFWGSKNVVGGLNWKEVSGIKDARGVTFAAALEQRGFTYTQDCAKRGDIKAYVELHIEQGAILEKSNMDIGIVTSIVGQKRFIVEIFGEANHAGTTPMGYRKDAGFASAAIISEIIQRAREYGPPMVLTVGQIEFRPNVTNVVPAYARFSVDIRHTDSGKLNSFTGEVLDCIGKKTSENQTSHTITFIADDMPVPMDEGIMELIQNVCEGRKVRYMKMPSGAGHDSQHISKIAPVGMIFVPSKNGISHSPMEFTEPGQLELGVEVLEDTLYKLAYL